jgi:hypothetical protein
VFNHYRWVTKRLVKGIFATPEGWPEGSPIWSSTVDSYRVIQLCNRHLTPKYRKFLKEAAATKRVHHMRTPRQIADFLRALRNEYPVG